MVRVHNKGFVSVFAKEDWRGRAAREEGRRNGWTETDVLLRGVRRGRRFRRNREPEEGSGKGREQ